MILSRGVAFVMLILSISQGCASGFYTARKTYDMWRLPIIEPYELVTPANYNDYQGYAFIFDSYPAIGNEDLSFYQLTNIEGIAMNADFIFLHSREGQTLGNKGSVWFAIPMRPSNGLETTYFFDYSSLSDYVDNENIEWIKLQKLVDDFHEGNELPDIWVEFR